MTEQGLRLLGIARVSVLLARCAAQCELVLPGRARRERASDPLDHERCSDVGERRK